MKPAFIDFETASGADLPMVGGFAYSRHSSTRVLCMCYKYGDTVGAWMGDGPVDEGLLAHAAAHGLCAHNAIGFDEHIWNRFIGGEYQWHDSSQLARAAGLPGGLDALGQRLEGTGKHEGGKAILKKMYTLTWENGEWGNKWIAPGSMRVLLEYCHRDVELMEKVWDYVQDYDNNDTAARVLDRQINRRGVAFDEDLAATVATISSQLVQQSLQDIARITDGKVNEKNIRSLPQMTKWLQDQGVVLPNLRRDTVEEFLEDPLQFTDPLKTRDPDAFLGLTPKVVQVLTLRNSCIRVTGAKLERASAACYQGRLYDMFWYHGAHTGRWSSRTVQVHNLSKGAKDVDIPGLLSNCTLDGVVREAGRVGCLPDDVLSALIRPCFIGDFRIADYNAIEARGLAWLADDTEVLENFRRGVDPYKYLATKMYGVAYDAVTPSQRSIAKIPELGCGYGMGPGRLNDFAAAMGVELEKGQAEELVDLWRDARPLIAGEVTGEWEGRKVRSGGLWRNYIEAFKGAMAGSVHYAGKCVFSPKGRGVQVRLPSGRLLTYRMTRFEDRVPPWGGNPIPAIVYEGAYSPKVLTPGTLTENINQAHCRDIMVESLKVLPAVLHVHDEIVWEEGMDLRAGLDYMATTPAWCQGMPIAAEGHCAPRYVKNPWPGYEHAKSR